MTITQERLKQLITYDPETGLFTWNIYRGGQYPGDLAGTPDGLGYWRISIDGRLYQSHRLAFLYVEGKFPDESVDHISRNPSDNSWKNLRKCTQKQNIWNSKGSGKYGKNVYFVCGETRKKKFNVKFEIGGKSKSFGYFFTPEEALIKANEIRNLLHGEFAFNN